MIKYKLLLALLLFSLISCTSTNNFIGGTVLSENSKNIFVTSYSSFGPPQLSNQLLGENHWQWDDPDNHKPISFDIKIVVYRNIPLKDVKMSFPVDPSKKQDYRYVSYSEASTYFDLELEKFEKEMRSYASPCDIGEMYIYPNELYRTALKMERKISQN